MFLIYIFLFNKHCYLVFFLKINIAITHVNTPRTNNNSVDASPVDGTSVLDSESGSGTSPFSSLTLTFICATDPSDATAVIIVVPAELAVTLPLLSTVATAGLDDFHDEADPFVTFI